MMAEQPDITNRINALLRPENAPPGGRRRRSFVAAAPAQKAANAAGSPAVFEDEDLPVLTEVVFAEDPVPEKKTDHFDEEARVSSLASEMAHAIGQQMAFELPTLIEATLLSASEDLRTGITSTMETALRDFIARRKQLRLPLD